MEGMREKKGRNQPPVYKGPKNGPAPPLITQIEFKMLAVLLETALEGGAYDHDAEIKAEYEELLAKVYLRGNIKTP